ncbi:MAG: hypothetical protein FWH07_07845 [Oscillospiraceae bacterium]|nr:hypothetical protein [Oscillospiraceae bacterium]
MLIQATELGNLNVINIIPPGEQNVYVFSEDGFAKKIVYEVKNTTLELLANAKGMSVPQLCTHTVESVVESFDTVLRVFADSIYRLAKKNIPSGIIAGELDTDSAKVDEIIRRAKILELAEQIEDDEILADITERAKSYGGIEAMLNAPGIPADEFWAKLGITGDLSDVEEFEIA